MPTPLKSFFLCVLLAGVFACTDSTIGDKAGESSTEDARSDTQGNPTLATVNGEAVRQSDVDFMIGRTFSSADQLLLDEQLQDKVLHSLVASKAMHLAMQATLTDEELTDIHSKVRAYREELFVKQYLQKNASPEPVSTAMVQDYYQSHLSEFGGGEQRSFELLKSARQATPEQREVLLKQVPILKQDTQWSDYAASNELELVYQRGVAQPGLLSRPLEEALSRLELDETSDVVMLNGIPHLLRLLELKSLPAEPLSAVSADIRKRLAALQLKQAVKTASEQAVAEAEVVYLQGQ